MGPIFDLRDLRAFLVVADEENLGRAAERLNVSASPLSRHMIQLEARLGVLLFERVRKRLRLTAAGREFGEQARALLSHATEIERAVTSASAGKTGRIEIGYVPGAMWSGLLPQLIRNARAETPGVNLYLHPIRSREGTDALRRGTLDIAFVHTLPGPDNEAILADSLVHRDAFCLVVPDSHPMLEGREAPKPAALGEEDWIALESARSPNFRSRFVAACGAYGFVPRIRHEAADIQSVLGLVEAGLGIALLQSAVKRNRPPGVAFVDLPGFSLDVRVYMQWRPQSQSQSAKRFIELARNFGIKA